MQVIPNCNNQKTMQGKRDVRLAQDDKSLFRILRSGKKTSLFHAFKSTNKYNNAGRNNRRKDLPYEKDIDNRIRLAGNARGNCQRPPRRRSVTIS